MTEVKTDGAGAAMHAARLRAILAVSRVWLDLEGEGRPRELAELVPAVVLSALLDGARLRWRGWTVRTLPARRAGDIAALGFSVPGILAISALGVCSESQVDAACVQRICRQLQTLEDRAMRDRGEDAVADLELDD